MILHYKLFINLSREAKRRFITEHLIPFLRDEVQDEYFFTRSVELHPVILLYVRPELAPRQELKRRGLSFRRSLQNLLDTYIDGLSAEERRQNDVYVKHHRDLERMNQLKKIRRDEPENLSVQFELLEFIERRGEFTFPEEPEIYNDTFFRTQQLMEDTTLYLTAKPQDEMILLLGMFYFSSKELDKADGGAGYLSYQSHVLGFLNYKKANVSDYARLFDHYYTVNAEVFDEVLDFFQSERFEDTDQPLMVLIRRWRDQFHEMYERLISIQRSATVSVHEAVKINMAHYKFRGISSFHDVAFDRKNRDYFWTKPFMAYRMLVNFVYLQLPRMGLSSRKRVQAGYILVRSVNHNEGKEAEEKAFMASIEA